MQTFRVYPKGKGEPFELTCDRFERSEDGSRFILYTEIQEPSVRAFLSFSDVAAIVPEHQRLAKPDPQNSAIEFRVYLRGRQEPITVWASAFKIDDLKASLAFTLQRKNFMHRVEREWDMPEVYVARTEVVAIFPVEGLLRED